MLVLAPLIIGLVLSRWHLSCSFHTLTLKKAVICGQPEDGSEYVHKQPQIRVLLTLKEFSEPKKSF